MAGYSPTLEALIEKFRSLPGIGSKTAVRLSFFMLNSSEDYVREFADCLTEAKSKTRTCKICQSLADADICRVCADDSRDRSLVCVVENAKDISTFERVKEYNGVYHVLHGAMSPMDGVGPDDIRVKELLARINGVNLSETPEGEEIAKTKVREVILATSSNVEGEATAMYISQLVKPFGVAASRLAYGLPVGGELEYADSVTLFKALEGRREM